MENNPQGEDVAGWVQVLANPTSLQLLQHSLTPFVCSCFFRCLIFIQFNLYHLQVSTATMENRIFVLQTPSPQCQVLLSQIWLVRALNKPNTWCLLALLYTHGQTELPSYSLHAETQRIRYSPNLRQLYFMAC